MKVFTNKTRRPLISGVCLLFALFILGNTGYAQQDSTAAAPLAEVKRAPRPVKNTFQTGQVIDAQTVMVPVKGTFQADIQHRFGSVQNGYKDLWGIYGIANIRFGFLYTPINNLEVGFGLGKVNMLWDGSLKYAIIKQTPGVYPVSVTYYGNAAVKTVENPDNVLFTYNSQRWSFFNEIMIARKINDKLSVQIGFSMSHQNSVPGYYIKSDTSTVIFKEQKFNMYAISFCTRYKLTEGTSFIFDYDQPLTTFATDNPHPNFAFGFEFNTSGHTFQLFAGNYTLLNPQQNSLYNANNPFGYTENGTKVPGGQFHIGFNITRLWNF
ncbi:MAG TPA: DUF5777 family beta-barrel protein [Puia sp.]|nr:DUF5777 family beta-barrel protein [Puia sp.]